MSVVYSLIYHRLGIVCPELIRKNIQVDEDESISFRDYDTAGEELGKSLYILILKTIPELLASVSAKIELHSQACNLVTVLNENKITSGVLLEIINSIFMVIAAFTELLLFINSILVFALRILILLFLKLCFSIVQKREISDAIDEPILEWTPILMSTNYEVQDQLTQWLITLINATSHLVHGNQLKLNIRDVLLFASDYSITGLAREEEAFKATDDKNRTKHYSQHQAFREKIQALLKQVSVFKSRDIAKRANNLFIEWLTVHVRLSDRSMVEKCIPKEKKREKTNKKHLVEEEIDESAVCSCTYAKKWQKIKEEEYPV
ncbi:hypothetical protein JH06_3129 [Blastocystis sp. subtype 4]|uniref:hypothetical protein n=1 Tax=Blastocystis sp. subtype 4 TaxID=944170 RepID=UPI0007120AA7|nr:hypothetical protein JH06_3129 [Blastocystis sp. subtype 4]KNB44853.1 hypothetical protein JH06_3129 [Blastocystis sp. subtype 4]|eukprot:XP_014528296.1 hypothetical protein JH06_3129 [Blastocystis sp. subtype 4]